MPYPASLLAFAAIALGMVLTPGPNMVYLVSRSICQGRTAGLISLAGVALSVLFLRESEVVGKRLVLGAALIVAGGALIGAFR